MGEDNWGFVDAEDWTTDELGHSGLGEFEDTIEVSNASFVLIIYV